MGKIYRKLLSLVMRVKLSFYCGLDKIHQELIDRARDRRYSSTVMHMICDSATHAGITDLPTQRQLARH